jgi:hypothetical protein
MFMLKFFFGRAEGITIALNGFWQISITTKPSNSSKKLEIGWAKPTPYNQWGN